MSKRDYRRWAYKQMREPAQPWPRWAIVLFWGVVVVFGLKLLQVI